MPEQRHNLIIGTFQERQKKFLDTIIFTYKFNVVVPPWWLVLRI